MRTLPVARTVFLLMLLGLSLHAGQFSNMTQTVEIQENGDARITSEISLTTTDSLPGLELACSFSQVSQLEALLLPEGSKVPVSHLQSNDIPYLRLDATLPPGEHKLMIKALVEGFLDWNAAGPAEFGTYEWEMVYENNQPITFAQGTLIIVLPAGWNFHRVLDSYPEFKKKDPKPPYTFSKANGQARVTIRRGEMAYRDRLGLSFTFKDEAKSRLLPVIGILVAVMYLYSFRDLILKHGAKDSDDPDTQGEG